METPKFLKLRKSVYHSFMVLQFSEAQFCNVPCMMKGLKLEQLGNWKQLEFKSLGKRVLSGFGTRKRNGRKRNANVRKLMLLYDTVTKTRRVPALLELLHYVLSTFLYSAF